MIRVLRKFLIVLSGAQPEILERCPSERTRFESLGWAILITSGIATVSMWFALNSAMGLNPFVSLLGALVWGLVIMGIDRWLVSSMPADGSQRFLVALPRVVLAVLLGTLISTPFVLRVFQSEINNQISIIKQNNAATFLTSQQHSAVAARVTKWQDTVNNLQQVIDSHGQRPINPASDPVVQGLTTQLSTERKVASTDYHAWQCQLYGGCGAPRGSGPLAAASQKRYNDDEAQISRLNREIQAREQALQANDLSSQQSRLSQAQGALPAAKAELLAAQDEENSLLNSFEATNNATNGLLIRLQALSQLSNNDFTVSAARFLLFLLFLVIECLPVTVKLMQRPGNYETILRTAAEHEVRNARRAFRTRPKESLPFSQDGQRAPEFDTNLHDIWQRTEPLPRPGFPDAATVTPPPRDLDPDDSADRGRLEDTAMREMQEINIVADSSPRGAGIPLRYDDDDL